MEELHIIRMEDFVGTLAIGLSGAPEVYEAARIVAAGAEREFYTRLLGVAETGRFFEDLTASDAEAEKFASLTRRAATRYAYCAIVSDSVDSLHAVNGVFDTDSATGEPVAPNRRLTATWNAMVLELGAIREGVDAYYRHLRAALDLPLNRRPPCSFRLTNTLLI